MVVNLVRRDLKVRHRGTFLGMLWSLTTPLMMVGLFYVVFKYILHASSIKDVRSVPFVVYLFCGLAVWNLFSVGLSGATGSILGSSYLLRKVYFPRAILPLTSVLSALVTFAFEFGVALVAAIISVGIPSWRIIWVPLLVLMVCYFTYGMGLLLAALAVSFRDVVHFVGILLQVWFWGTPILYSLQFVDNHPGFQFLLKLNPMTGLVVGFRNVVLLNHPPSVPLLAYDLLASTVVFVVGAVVFNHGQRMFPELV
ncbi:MAG TPA: ABC transporter permease [Acidimicrobiales bacterium]|nr:ABC transporter permease [Acidimicrobiales bacterium]